MQPSGQPKQAAFIRTAERFLFFCISFDKRVVDFCKGRLLICTAVEPGAIVFFYSYSFLGAREYRGTMLTYRKERNSETLGGGFFFHGCLKVERCSVSIN